MKKNKDKTFKRHFRIYFKNNHPAYIIDEEGNMYVFHRVTHSKTSGGKKTWEKKNPLNDSDKRKIHIVKREEKDMKGRFSIFELDLIDGVDVSYPEIKKVGAAQTKQDINCQGRAWIPSDSQKESSIQASNNIKTNKTKKRNKKR